MLKPMCGKFGDKHTHTHEHTQSFTPLLDSYSWSSLSQESTCALNTPPHQNAVMHVSNNEVKCQDIKDVLFT